jgi:hypothetical protein
MVGKREAETVEQGGGTRIDEFNDKSKRAPATQHTSPF